jgi:hypothetical protein
MKFCPNKRLSPTSTALRKTKPEENTIIILGSFYSEQVGRTVDQSSVTIAHDLFVVYGLRLSIATNIRNIFSISRETYGTVFFGLKHDNPSSKVQRFVGSFYLIRLREKRRQNVTRNEANG